VRPGCSGQAVIACLFSPAGTKYDTLLTYIVSPLVFPSRLRHAHLWVVCHPKADT